MFSFENASALLRTQSGVLELLNLRRLDLCERLEEMKVHGQLGKKRPATRGIDVSCAVFNSPPPHTHTLTPDPVSLFSPVLPPCHSGAVMVSRVEGIACTAPLTLHISLMSPFKIFWCHKDNVEHNPSCTLAVLVRLPRSYICYEILFMSCTIQTARGTQPQLVSVHSLRLR